MLKVMCPVAVLGLAVLAGWNDTPMAAPAGGLSSQAAGDSKDSKPTKERAVQTLQDLLAALEAKDYDKAITFLQAPPQSRAQRTQEIGRSTHPPSRDLQERH